MRLDYSNNYLKSLIDAGSDAMQNLYIVEFSGKGVDAVHNSLTIRNSDFTPPTFTQGKDKKHFLTVDVDMPTASITGDKSFSLTFRLDSNYGIYHFLLAQQASTMSGNEGWATNRVPESADSKYGLTIRVYAYNGEKGSDGGNEIKYFNDSDTYTKMYEFRYCWIKSLDPISYSYENNSPLTVKANIGFMDFDDPMNTIAREKGDEVNSALSAINNFLGL